MTGPRGAANLTRTASPVASSSIFDRANPDRWSVRPADLGWLICATALVGVGWQLGHAPFAAPTEPIDSPIDLSQFKRATIMPPKPAVIDPPHVTAEQSDVRPEELVLGIVIGGEARAYPLNMLSGPIREILNDTLAGEPVAVTWCDFCHDAIVYSRRVNQQVLTLIVAGSMWEQSMVIRDNETGSLWSQVLGRAMEGELAGQTLEILPAVNTTWSDWKHRHPETTVAQLPRERQEYTRNFHRDRRRFVLGLRRGSDSGAVTFQTLAARLVLNVQMGGEPLVITYDDEHSAARVFARTVDRQTLEFLPSPRGRMRDRQTSSIWDAGSGLCLEGKFAGAQLPQRQGLVAYTSVWRRFHPDSRDLSEAH